MAPRKGPPTSGRHRAGARNTANCRATGQRVLCIAVSLTRSYRNPDPLDGAGMGAPVFSPAQRRRRTPPRVAHGFATKRENFTPQFEHPIS